ncbi:hypothetical protein IFR05_017279, partial [Cadophora sp. M221]
FGVYHEGQQQCSTRSSASACHLRDFGKPIYKGGSRAVLLATLEGCIEGHESLRRAGFFHRDILINNLMMNEGKENPSWPSFLIDLDLGIKETQREASDTRGETGTRAFMAIGGLLGEHHSFIMTSSQYSECFSGSAFTMMDQIGKGLFHN